RDAALLLHVLADPLRRGLGVAEGALVEGVRVRQVDVGEALEGVHHRLPVVGDLGRGIELVDRGDRLLELLGRAGVDVAEALLDLARRVAERLGLALDSSSPQAARASARAGTARPASSRRAVEVGRVVCIDRSLRLWIG